MSIGIGVDLHGPITEICERLDLAPNTVLQLDITPTSLEATVATLNEDGAKFINDDGEVAMETHSFDIQS